MTLLSAPELFADPSEKDDDLLDQYFFNEPIIDFNDKDEPLEGPKNHNDPTKSGQPNHNSNDQTRTIYLTNTPVIIEDNNKSKKPLNLETKYPVCSQMFSNEEIAEHANVCAETKFEESANSKEEKEQPSEYLQSFQNLAHQQKPLSSKFMMSSDESLKFIMRRNNVVDDVMRKMNMFFKNSVIKPITVEFVGKEAADDGGPLRELYTIFYDNGSGKLLYGPEKNYSFMHDAHRNEKCQFYLFGKFVAIGLLKRVPGPHCFCKPLVEYILSDDVTASTITVQLTDVPVFEVKKKLEAISNAQSEDELASCLKDFEERFESGSNKFLIKLSDKVDLLQKVSR